MGLAEGLAQVARRPVDSHQDAAGHPGAPDRDSLGQRQRREEPAGALVADPARERDPQAQLGREAPDVREVPRSTVDAESASAGIEVVRLVARLVTAWQEDPPGVLRSGGLGVRDLRRAATTLEVDDATAAFLTSTPERIAQGYQQNIPFWVKNFDLAAEKWNALLSGN